MFPITAPKGTPIENKATVDGSLAFFGDYSLTGTVLNLHIECSTFPNWIGADQKRTNVVVTGDELKYNEVASDGSPAALVIWQRMK